MSLHDIYPENVLLSGIRNAVETAERGTILNALNHKQINTIVKEIIKYMASQNLDITDIKPVNDQVQQIKNSLNEMGKEYIENHTELSYARGAIEEIRQGKLNEEYTQELMSKIQPPDYENHLVLYWIKNHKYFEEHAKENIDRLLKMVEKN